eukprot:Blabericola_migrator_1__7260@NODE_368_length_9339_cov_86_801014_g295_i0_p1_GENE_NODE_368_length_9339_cov_86_801014_g295_i0NODE_368_length_9339_cov_86_801014_g295_i0_p1_ORF_typecomplete_len1269_score232_91SNCAIP_SNCA_bd/PF16700_5/0_013FANCI_S2/PF14676_6/26FANCI_S2/PF14676_6/2_4e03FANCI_S2/PF14676_6/71_NODE_368_length_9339_cov_86_801014_g295_i034077213
MAARHLAYSLSNIWKKPNDERLFALALPMAIQVSMCPPRTLQQLTVSPRYGNKPMIEEFNVKQAVSGEPRSSRNVKKLSPTALNLEKVILPPSSPLADSCCCGGFSPRELRRRIAKLCTADDPPSQSSRKPPTPRFRRRGSAAAKSPRNRVRKCNLDARATAEALSLLRKKLCLRERLCDEVLKSLKGRELKLNKRLLKSLWAVIFPPIDLFASELSNQSSKEYVSSLAQALHLNAESTQTLRALFKHRLSEKQKANPLMTLKSVAVSLNALKRFVYAFSNIMRAELDVKLANASRVKAILDKLVTGRNASTPKAQPKAEDPSELEEHFASVFAHAKDVPAQVDSITATRYMKEAAAAFMAEHGSTVISVATAQLVSQDACVDGDTNPRASGTYVGPFLRALEGLDRNTEEGSASFALVQELLRRTIRLRYKLLVDQQSLIQAAQSIDPDLSPDQYADNARKLGACVALLKNFAGFADEVVRSALQGQSHSQVRNEETQQWIDYLFALSTQVELDSNVLRKACFCQMVDEIFEYDREMQELESKLEKTNRGSTTSLSESAIQSLMDATSLDRDRALDVMCRVLAGIVSHEYEGVKDESAIMADYRAAVPTSDLGSGGNLLETGREDMSDKIRFDSQGSWGVVRESVAVSTDSNGVATPSTCVSSDGYFTADTQPRSLESVCQKSGEIETDMANEDREFKLNFFEMYGFPFARLQEARDIGFSNDAVDLQALIFAACVKELPVPASPSRGLHVVLEAALRQATANMSAQGKTSCLRDTVNASETSLDTLLIQFCQMRKEQSGQVDAEKEKGFLQAFVTGSINLQCIYNPPKQRHISLETLEGALNDLEAPTLSTDAESAQRPTHLEGQAIDVASTQVTADVASRHKMLAARDVLQWILRRVDIKASLDEIVDWQLNLLKVAEHDPAAFRHCILEIGRYLVKEEPQTEEVLQGGQGVLQPRIDTSLLHVEIEESSESAEAVETILKDFDTTQECRTTLRELEESYSTSSDESQLLKDLINCWWDIVARRPVEITQDVADTLASLLQVSESDTRVLSRELSRFRGCPSFVPKDAKLSARSMIAMLDEFCADLKYCMWGRYTATQKLAKLLEEQTAERVTLDEPLLNLMWHTLYPQAPLSLVHLAKSLTPSRSSALFDESVYESLLERAGGKPVSTPFQEFEDQFVNRAALSNWVINVKKQSRLLMTEADTWQQELSRNRADAAERFIQVCLGASGDAHFSELSRTLTNSARAQSLSPRDRTRALSSRCTKC